MFKSGQFSSVYAPGLAGKTLHDLYREIERDVSLSQTERIRLINQIRGSTNNASSSTPLSSLMYSGLGGVLGYLISKYFGMSTIGRAVGAVVGVNLGKMLYNQFNKPISTSPPGFRLLN